MGILEDAQAQGQAMPPEATPAGQAPAPQGGQGQLPAPNPEITSPLVQEHMDELAKMREMMDDKMGDAYDRVLTAGMKMLYAPESSQVVADLISNEEVPMANKLGEGVANLVVMMDNQGNGTIPKEVLIPVGVALMFEAADYLFEVGVDVTEEDLGGALELLINGVFTGYGIDPKKMEEVIDDMGKKLGFEEGAEPAEAGEVEEAETEEAGFEQGFNAEQAQRQGV